MISSFLDSAGFMPHGHCFLWTPSLLWTYALSDSVIAASYYSVPVALWYFVKKRQDMPYGWIFILFGLFVMACGTTHLFSVIDIWLTEYWADAAVRGVTAIVSATSAIALWRVMPHALAIPSRSQLEHMNRQLAFENSQRVQAEARLSDANKCLEDMVAARTSELLKANGDLLQEVAKLKAAQSNIVKLSRLYAALSRCNEAIIRCSSEADLFPSICQAAVEGGGIQFAWIGLLDSDSSEVRAVAHFGKNSSILDKTRVTISENDPYSLGPTGTAIRKNHPCWVQDVLKEPVSLPWRALATFYGWRSVASLPIRKNGIPVGAMTLYMDEPEIFDGEVQKLMVEMSEDVSFSLDNYARITERNMAMMKAHESDVRFQALIEEASDIVAVISQEGIVHYISPSVKRSTGHDPEALKDRNVMEFIHPADKQNAIEHMSEILANPNTVHQSELRYRSADGFWRIYETMSRNLLSEPAVRGIVVNLRDVTERRQEEKALALNEAKFRALAEQALVGIYTIDQGTIAYMNPRAASIFGYQPDELIGMPALYVIAEADKEMAQANIFKRLSGEIDSIQYDFRGIRKDGTEVLIGAHGNTINLDGRKAIMGVLQDVTDKVIAQQAISDYIARIERMIMGTVDAISSLVEMRDPYTAGHERRVGMIAMAIAKEMGLAEEVQVSLRIAGAVHDVGKIAVPAEILSKPSGLKPLEYQMVQAHAAQGYEVLRKIDSPWPIAEIARQHHERMDGSGYPQGLKGGEILLEARIMAVADVVEAMASHRPYRAGLGIAAALSEIEENRGKLYDPAVCEACLRLFREQGFEIPK